MSSKLPQKRYNLVYQNQRGAPLPNGVLCLFKKMAEFKKRSVTKQVGGLVTVLLTETFRRDRQGQAMKTL